MYEMVKREDIDTEHADKLDIYPKREGGSFGSKIAAFYAEGPTNGSRMPRNFFRWWHGWGCFTSSNSLVYPYSYTCKRV
jgi:hypothetical protein